MKSAVLKTCKAYCEAELETFVASISKLVSSSGASSASVLKLKDTIRKDWGPYQWNTLRAACRAAIENKPFVSSSRGMFSALLALFTCFILGTIHLNERLSQAYLLFAGSALETFVRKTSTSKFAKGLETTLQGVLNSSVVAPEALTAFCERVAAEAGREFDRIVATVRGEDQDALTRHLARSCQLKLQGAYTYGIVVYLWILTVSSDIRGQTTPSKEYIFARLTGEVDALALRLAQDHARRRTTTLSDAAKESKRALEDYIQQKAFSDIVTMEDAAAQRGRALRAKLEVASDILRHQQSYVATPDDPLPDLGAPEWETNRFIVAAVSTSSAAAAAGPAPADVDDVVIVGKPRTAGDAGIEASPARKIKFS